MPPPPAEQFASRIFLGPALRTQSDRRLVTLVRDGYEAAFEEIVRRYRRPLDRFAASIVGDHSEDVTQDALSKALLALRGSEAEIELRPWLYRIVRNTALNDLRDRPPATAELPDSIGAGPSAAAEAERREEMSDLMTRLRALPEPQRAAIVMRELEGLSHEEIAAALGVSGGAARQAIHRARTSLRDGLGMLVPLPLLRTLFDHGAEAAAGGVLATSAAGGGAAVFGGIGAGGALKLGAATVLIAGSLGAGVAIQHDHGGGPEPAAAAQSPAWDGGGGLDSPSGEGSGGSGGGDGRGGPGPGHSGSDSGGQGSSGGSGGSSGPSSGSEGSGGGSSGRGSGPGGGSGSGHGGDSGGERSGSGSGEDGGHSGKGGGGTVSGGDRSGGSSGDGSGGGDSSGGGERSGSGSGDSGSGSGGSGSDDSGSDSSELPPPVSEPVLESGSGGGSGSGADSSGSGDGSIIEPNS
jgi:RNA polymerase sigma factor (sigma-70 family)